MNDAPDFSGIAREYAASRPSYPAELFEWLASVAPGREVAWDAATGNGQAARGLADHFARVIATDRSAEQLEHATPHPRIEYRVATSEDSGLAAASVDLATSAAAIHWFDLARYGREVVRVLRPGGVVAAWTYHVAYLDPPLDLVLAPFYDKVVRPYFAAGARLVDAKYAGIELPGEELAAPPFKAKARWSAADLLRFVETWSGVLAYRHAMNEDPVARIAAPIREVFGGDDAIMDVSWPLYVRAAKQP